MATLAAFLHPELPEEEELIISERFKENGEVVPFKIRPVTQEVNKALIKQNTKQIKKGASVERKFDTDRYQDALIVAGTAFPDFRAKELCDAYGVVDPLLIPPKMLLAGEYQKLLEAIMILSGIGDDAVEEEAEEAKN